MISDDARTSTLSSTSGDSAPVSVQSAAPSTTSIRTVLPWILGVTRPVHAPLYFSTLMRIVELSLNVVLFGFLMREVLTLAFDPAHEALLRVVGIILAIACVKALAYYLEQFSGHFVAFKALELLRARAFASLWPKAPGVLRHATSGDLIASLTRDIDRIEVLYAHTLAPVIAGIIVPLGLGVSCALIWGWHIALPAFICSMLSACVVPLIGFQSSLASTSESLLSRRRLSQHVTDSVFGAEEVVSYGREAERLEEMSHIDVDIRHGYARPSRYRALRRAANIMLTYSAIALTVLIGIGTHTSPEIIAFIAGGCMVLFDAPRGLEDAVGALDHSLAAARRLYDICHIPALVDDGPHELPPASAHRDSSLSPTHSDGDSLGVRWDHVSYAYPDARRTPVLHDFSAEAPAGKHTLIIAPSGSGKSTAVQLLVRYDDPTSGTVYLGDSPVTDYTLTSLRRSVALVPQRPELLNTTIRDNLLLAAPDATESELWQALALAHIDDDIRQMPAGLNTPTGTEGSGLSGGQMQRLCLARALLTSPRVLVLDEFTANVNSELDEAIHRSLQQALPHLTIIEITHQRDMCSRADHVIEL